MSRIHVSSLALLLSFILVGLLILVFVLVGDIGIWFGLGLLGLYTSLVGIAIFGRPSVREALPVLIALKRAERAFIRGDFATMGSLCGRAIARSEACGRYRDFLTGAALVELGYLYHIQGRWADCEPIFLRAVSHFDVARREGSPSTRVASRGAMIGRLNLASLYINQGRFAEAEPVNREIDASTKKDSTLGPLFSALYVYNRGQMLAVLGRPEEAEVLTRRAMTMLGRPHGRGKQVSAFFMAGLADIRRLQGRLDEAVTLARIAVEAGNNSVFGAQHAIQTPILNVLAEVLRARGIFDEAEHTCVRSQTLTEKAFGPDHIWLDGCLGTLARIRVAQGRYADAANLLLRCLSILEMDVVPTHVKRLDRRAEYAKVLRLLGRHQEAIQWEPLAAEVPVLEKADGAYTARILEPPSR